MICSTLYRFFIRSTGFTPQNSHSKPSSFWGLDHLRLAQELGLATTKSWVEDFGGIPVIVVERFDRAIRGSRVYRLHQEDMCQALGARPQTKYQNQGGPSPKAIAELLWNNSAESRRDVLTFADALIFNWLLGGTDAHAKNYSLLLEANSVSRLAPLYDLASSIPYPRQIDPRKAKLAMKIGHHYRIREISPRDWDRCARELRLGTSDLSDRLESIIVRLPEAGLDIASEMDKAGLTHPVVTFLADHLPARIKSLKAQLTKRESKIPQRRAALRGKRE